MISSSLSIKILGCIVVALVTIATPTIISIKKTARQKEIDASFGDFLKNKEGSFAFHAGETFSGKLFENWKPSETEQKMLFDNWSTKIKHLPIEFFSLFLSRHNTKPQPTTKFKDICYLKINYVTNETSKLDRSQQQFIFAPFSKDKLTSTLKNQQKRAWKFSGSETNYRSHAGTSANSTTIEPSDADISFVESLYKTTSTHIKKLSFTQVQVPYVWQYDSEHCSTDAATSTASK